MAGASDEVVLGSISGVFGFRGEVRLHLHNREGDTLSRPRDVVLLVQGLRRPARLTARPGAGKRVLGRVEGVNTEEEARLLVGAEIRIARAELSELPAGEYYVGDLVGLRVEDHEGVHRGAVVEIVAGDRDVWIIETVDGEDAFVVATSKTVLRVDVAGGVVVVAGDALEST